MRAITTEFTVFKMFNQQIAGYDCLVGMRGLAPNKLISIYKASARAISRSLPYLHMEGLPTSLKQGGYPPSQRG